MERRNLEIVILSDVHLGTFECHSKELLNYLRHIRTEILILNGDFIDSSLLKKNNFSKKHANIIREILDMAFQGTKVYYITANREKIFKQFSQFSSNSIDVREKLELQLKGKKYWIFHGDSNYIFFKYSSFLISIGSRMYGLLLRSDRIINKWRTSLGKVRMSYAGRIKNRIRQSVKAISDFEETAVQLAREQGYDYVICGHIHQPVIKTFGKDGEGSVTYMNSGDWVENLTALEYSYGRWELHKYDELDYAMINPKLHVRSKSVKTEEILRDERFGSIIETDNQLGNRVVGE